jgi:hypothetical protein
MKLTAAIVMIALAAAAPLACTAPPSDSDATAAALSWLALVDGGDYAHSWSSASKLFRGSVEESKWVDSVARTRGLFGALQSRKLLSATAAHTLPGAPDGEYCVIRFRSAFEKKAEALETVTPMKDEDGHWRVSGYFIK